MYSSNLTSIIKGKLEMPIEVIEITQEQQKQILELKENHFHDVKSIDIKPSNLTRTLSAFANADGGEIYIGIDEEIVNRKKVRKWRGFADQEAANGHIQAFEQFFPLGQYFVYSFMYCRGSDGLVVKTEIHKTRDIRKASNKIAYLRRSAQNFPLKTQDQLKRLRLNKGITTNETETVPFNPSILENSVILKEFVRNVVPSTTSMSWLKKQYLIQEGKPIIAAILLFAEEPQAILPKRCGIKILQYGTRARTGSRQTLLFEPITIEGCLYESIRKAVLKTAEIVENTPILTPQGLKPITYPRVTLHEIITNAVLHRDYSIATDIQVRIYDNRIEIESPGKLPAHITPQNILHQQFARNPVIVRLINKFPDPPNRDVGEGLRTAFNAMTRLKLKSPLIKDGQNSVTVVIRHEPLARPEEIVMNYLVTHREISNTKARQLTGMESGDAMKQVLYRLRDKELIEPVPGKHGMKSSWQKVGIQLKLPFDS